MTLEMFKWDRKTDDDSSNQFTMSVSTGKMQGSKSLITHIVILSWPDALLDEKDVIILWIS